MRSDPVLNPVGMPVDDPYPAVVDTQRIGGNLRYDLNPLTAPRQKIVIVIRIHPVSQSPLTQVARALG